jgi:hypothetical protein
MSLSEPKLEQPGFRPSLSDPNRSGLTPPRSTPTTPEKKKIYPVYLRPEQNIPDIFATTTFQPISPGSVYGAERQLQLAKDKHGKHKISRDDIVVTVRSAQV